MGKVGTQIYTFEQLSDKAKERAREWWRESSYGDWEAELDSYETAARLLGIEDVKIAYSGFSCQGDGASFTGSYGFTAKDDFRLAFKVARVPANIREHFPNDTKLHKIADEFTALQQNNSWQLAAKVTRRDNRYCHAYTMDAEVWRGENEDAVDNETEKQLIALLRNFAGWIYKCLETDYDWFMSDENADECMIANDYKFTENGTQGRDYALPSRQRGALVAQPA